MKSEWIDRIVEKNKPLQSCWKTRKKGMQGIMKHFDSGLGTESTHMSKNKKTTARWAVEKQL